MFELEIEKTARPAEEVLRVRRRFPAISFVVALPDFFTDLARVVRICWRLLWARSCESPSVKANAKITVSNRDGISRIRYGLNRCTWADQGTKNHLITLATLILRQTLDARY